MKMISRVLMTAVAVAALAAPAMAADKLIVRDATDTSDVIKLTDAGQVVMPKTGINRTSMMSNPSLVDNFAYVAFSPVATSGKAGTSFQIIPYGAGFSAQIKAQLAIFNTDLIADSVNYENLVVKAGGTSGYSFNSAGAGTGLARPINFQISSVSKMTIATNGYVGIGTTTPNSPLAVVGLPTYANNAAALAGALVAGDLYKTSTGQLMVVY